jgi:gamma-glutamyltranspeptidase
MAPARSRCPAWWPAWKKRIAATQKLPWKELLAPSISLAGEGLAVDWWTTLMISSAAADLRRYGASAAAYLQDGLPPNPQWGIKSKVRMPQDRLKATMAQLASAGPRDFYEGDLAQSLAADIQAAGGVLSVEDLKPFRSVLRDPLAIPYRGGKVFATPELTAGPTLSRTLGLLQNDLKPARGGPDAAAYVAYASALQAAYRERLKDMGDQDGRRALGAEALAPACTTHFSVVDRDGNMAAVTQTLLSTFGSKFVSGQTGITMNNGIMWFDPDAGHAELAGAGQALPDQLYSCTGTSGRWPPRRDRRFRRPTHPAGGEPAAVLCDGLRHGPRRGDPPAPHRRQRRRHRDRRCAPAAGCARGVGRAFRLRGSAHPELADEVRLPQRGAA